MDQKRGYRGFQTEANSRKIQCEHHLVADLFVRGKSVLAGTAGFRVVVGADPYGFVQKFLLAGIICQSLKFLLSHFDTSATKLRIKLKGGRVG